MVRQHDRKRVKNTKVLPYEAVTKQYRLLVGDISGETGKAKRETKRVPKTKVWKLKRADGRLQQSHQGIFPNGTTR